MARPLEPRKSKVAVPLPDDATLTPDIRPRLQQLPALNNLRMFANVPHCFLSITSLIDQLFHAGTIDPLREYMYLRIAIKYGLYDEYRHNLSFSERLGITDGEIAALRSDGPVDRLSADGNLVCAAAEEITERFSVGDETLTALLERFGTEGAGEIILLVSWFNLLIRYVESTRVPYEKDLGDIIKGGAPLGLK
ncbi:MAG: hypothetical protein WB500_13945, partial [Rhodoplanes sp.]